MLQGVAYYNNNRNNMGFSLKFFRWETYGILLP